MGSRQQGETEEGVRATRWELGGQSLVVLSVLLGEPLPSTLTASEREVCRLLLCGLSDSEIARRRGVASRTVANQCRAIYNKLGVHSRSELCIRLGSPAKRGPAEARGLKQPSNDRRPPSRSGT